MGLIFKFGQAVPDVLHFSVPKKVVLWTRVKEELHTWIGTKNQNYPCYQILKNFLKNVCIRGCIPFLIRIMLSITYSFDSGNSILHLML